MKTKNIFIFSVFLLGLLFVSACSDDSKDSGDPYYTFDGNIETIHVGIDGIAKNKMKPIVIRSNRSWTVNTSDQDQQWLHTFVDEGEDDGIFYYWVDANLSFKGREGHINLYSNGDKVKTITITQDASVPLLSFVNAEGGYTALPTAGQTKIAITANIPWKASIEACDWAKIDSVGKDTVYISLTKNTDDKRSVVISCQGEGEFSSMTSSTTLTQSAPGIILFERFDWLQEGKEDYYYNYPEVNFTKWSDGEKAMGWTTLGEAMYGGRGYTKIGKTNYAGDLVSPALTAIKSSTKAKVSFQCIGYMASNGKKDDGVLSVGLIGPGTIVADKTDKISFGGSTYDVAVFDITIYPDSPKNEHGEGYNPWNEPASKFQFTINGATDKTQIVFIGGPKWGRELKGTGQGKNRLFLDNIKIQEQE